MAILRSKPARAGGLFLLAGAALCGSQVSAQPVPQLSRLLRAQLQLVPQAVDACTLGDGADDGQWDVTTFFLDVTPYVSVGIQSVFQVTVTPEFLFVWTRGEDDGG